MNKSLIEKYYGVQGILDNPTLSENQKIDRLVSSIAKYAERLEELEKMPSLLHEIIREHESKQCMSRGVSEPERVKGVLRHYQDTATNALAGAEAFRDRTLIWLRAMIICLDMVSNAGTHGEKNARLRGAIEVTERFVKALQEEKFDLSRVYWQWERDFFSFRSDYPVRELLERNSTLKHELQQANEYIEELNKEREKVILNSEVSE